MLNIEKGYILYAILFFIFFMIALLVYSTIALLKKNKIDKNRRRWINKIEFLIRRAIFFEGEDNSKIPVPPKTLKLFEKKLFRDFFIYELASIAKSITGVSNENLIKLYEQQELTNDSRLKLNNSLWHIKARGIQELALMEQKDYADQLFELTNNKNDFIRMESQTAMVKFEGFAGLKFLDTAIYPISEWHQINLLHELSRQPAEEFQGIERWLASENDTVVIFSLKLTGTYHQFNLYDDVVTSLNHKNPAVVLEAIKCLQEIYTDTTSNELISIYEKEISKTHQLTILKALKVIGAEENILFLHSQLSADDNQIKLAAARALANSGPDGMNELLSYSKSDMFPWNDIIRQIKYENI